MIDSRLEACIKHNEKLSSDCMSSYRDDKEAVKRIALYDGAALKYVSDELKADKEVVMAAVKYNGFALFQADESLLTDRDLTKQALITNSKVYNYIFEDFTKDEALIFEVMEENYHLFSSVGGFYRNNRELAEIAISQNGDYYDYIGDNLREDRELAQLALETQRNGKVLRGMVDTFRNDLDMVLMSASRFPNSVFDCGSELQHYIRGTDTLKAIEILTLTKELNEKKASVPEKKKVVKI